MPIPLTQSVVEQWISLIKGKFNVRDIWSEVGIESPEGKAYLRVILSRLEVDGIISSNGGGGIYRRIDLEAPVINWQGANSENILPVKWPFELEKYCAIYPKNVVIVAGSKQEGKSTFLYNFIKLNMNTYQIDLFSNETGPEQMKDRFTDLGIPPDAPFTVKERYDNFADVIHPNHISVIDYLDMNSEFYLAGTEIDAIFRKTESMVVIGMQIPPPTTTFVKGVKHVIDRDYAYGGGTTAKRAFIYISMSSHRLKIKHAKKPAQPKVNPANMTWSYGFDEKGQFTNIMRYYGDEEEET
jgi:hypothetical protein